MPFTITQPEAYVLDQVFPFVVANNLFENDRQTSQSFDVDHDFGTDGAHDTPRVANEIGLFQWDDPTLSTLWGVGLDGVTPIVRSSTGEYIVAFDGAYANQDFVPIIGHSGNAEGDSSDVLRSGWSYISTNKDDINIWFRDKNGATRDPFYFTVAIFGV